MAAQASELAYGDELMQAREVNGNLAWCENCDSTEMIQVRVFYNLKYLGDRIC